MSKIVDSLLYYQFGKFYALFQAELLVQFNYDLAIEEFIINQRNLQPWLPDQDLFTEEEEPMPNWSITLEAEPEEELAPTVPCSPEPDYEELNSHVTWDDDLNFY